MTSQDSPTAVVASLYDLFGQGRLEETFALMHPDVVLHEPGDPDVLPWAGTHRGHDGLRRFYDGLADGLSEIAIEPTSLELFPIAHDAVLALGTERGTAAATGGRYETASAWLWTLRDGRIVGMRAFHDTAAMHRAFRG